MKTDEVREWLRKYAYDTNDENLSNIVDECDDYTVWKEYVSIMAKRDKVKIGLYLTEQAPENQKEALALGIAKTIFDDAYLSRFGIVYKPSWLDDTGEDVVKVNFRVFIEVDEFLERYGKLITFCSSLTESEKEALKKLLN